MSELGLVAVDGQHEMAIPTPKEARAIMGNLQAVMQAVLDDSDYAVIQGKKWRKRSGFTKLRRVFSVSIEVLDERWEDLGDGEFGYSVSVRATFPNGRYEDGDGYCDSMELSTGHISPTRHNVRSKARTRAKNRATADLLGTGEVSADELTEYHEQQGTQRQQGQTNGGNGGKAHRPIPAHMLREGLRQRAGWKDGKRLLDGEPVTEKQTGFVAGLLDQAFEDIPDDMRDKARHDVLRYLFDVDSTTKLTKAEASTAIDWLHDPNNMSKANAYAKAEASGILQAAAVEAGQQEMPL